MRRYFAAFALLVPVLFCGCEKDAGEPVTMNDSIEGTYTELQVEDAFDVTVSDMADQISVTAGDKIIARVVVEKDGDKLVIRLKPMTNTRGSALKVVLPYNPDLKKVELSGASDFRSPFPLKGKKTEVELSGASDYYGDIEADDIELDLSGGSNFRGFVKGSNLDVELSGASDAELEGQVTTLKLDLSGSSSIIRKVIGKNYALSCDRCEGSMSGSSNAFIHCDVSIKASLSGASDLHYTGNAATAGCSTSGGSNVIHDVL